MKDEIKKRLDENIKRVENLVDIYEHYLQGTGKGRRKGHFTDVLRSATVLLHASMEDFLRSLASWKLPDCGEDVINKIPIAGTEGKNPNKFFLGKLVQYRGQSVDDLIKKSVEESLDRSNYNNITEISNLLKSIGVSCNRVHSEFSNLTQLMERRHKIVHRADRNETKGKGHHPLASISVHQVKKWIKSVRKFSEEVLSEIIDVPN